MVDYYHILSFYLLIISYYYIHVYRPETEEYGISSFVFRARRPFHPERLMEFINTELASNSDDDDDDDDEIVENDDKRSSNIHKESSDETLPIPSLTTPTVLRSKGFFWLATRYKENLQWSQAGGLFRISPGGYWWVDTPKELWPEGSEEVAQIMADFDTANVELGDRRYVFILFYE